VPLQRHTVWRAVSPSKPRTHSERRYAESPLTGYHNLPHCGDRTYAAARAPDFAHENFVAPAICRRSESCLDMSRIRFDSLAQSCSILAQRVHAVRLSENLGISCLGG